jgi:hypothetical protein
MGNELVSGPATRTGALMLMGRKPVLAAVAAAVAASASPAWADIELGEGLSVTGFVDMSFYNEDWEGSPASKSFGIDQVEVDFLYTGSNGISAQVDIEYGESGSDLGAGDDTFVEQAFITKKFNDSFSIKAGRFLSYSGWETEEPTGLFQYSGTGYGQYFYGYYQQGISAYYDGGKFAIMGSVVNDVFGWTGGPTQYDTDDLGFEVGIALMPVEGLTAKAFYMSDDKTGYDVINAWVSYSYGGFTFAGEYNDADYGDDGEGDGFLLMANYASGPWGITLRYHDFEIKNDLGTIDEGKGFTISPSYAVGDNLLLVAEYRRDKAFGAKGNMFALEALFTF